MPWARRRYRGNKVWVEVDAEDAPVLDERGLAKVRYKPDDVQRTYSVRPSEVHAVDDPSAPAAPKRAARKRSSRASGEAPVPADRDVGDGDPVADASPAGRTGVPEPFAPGDDVPALAGLEVHAWTDGAASGNPGPAGIGVVLLFREHVKEVSRYLGETTNNVAELTAVLVALRLMKRRHLPVRIHVDSTYTIGVATGAMRAKANADLVEEIRAETRGFSDLRFVKVSAHSGVEHNERADALARLAIKKRGPPL
jgi:ribonuclease HI